jgi:hypothetical protein
MADVLIASAVIFAVLGGWLCVQALYRRFALQHPELGPFRPDSACGGSCDACGSDRCEAGGDAQGAPQLAVRVAFEAAGERGKVSAGRRRNNESTGG